MQHLNGVFVNNNLMKQINTVSSNQPRKDVNRISKMHLHFFESNKMHLDCHAPAVLRKTNYGLSKCRSNDLVSFTKEEMESKATLEHIRKLLLTMVPGENPTWTENVQKITDVLNFAFTLRSNKIGEGADFTIFGFYCDESGIPEDGVHYVSTKVPVRIVVIDCPVYEDCSDASTWKARVLTAPFRFAVYTLEFGDFDTKVSE